MDGIDGTLANGVLRHPDVESIASTFPGKIDQVGIIVSDLEAALEKYNTIWPMGRWKVYTYGPETVPALTYRGEPGMFIERIALTDSSPQVELIEPVRGPSIFHEWMKAHGVGIHHVAMVVDSLAASAKSMEAAGLDVIQSGVGYGLDGDGGFAFFDTEAILGITLELVEKPLRRMEPEYVFPSAQ